MTVSEKLTIDEARQIAFETLRIVATCSGWEHIKDLIGRELDITDEIIDGAVTLLISDKKEKYMNAMAFLISIPIVALISVLSLVFFHAEKLPDPLNVVTILTVAFGPMSLMLYYFITRLKTKI